MTEPIEKSIRILRPRPKPPTAILPLILLSSILSWFVIRYPTAAGEAALDGMLLAARRVLPTLFPFLVLSTILLRTGFAETLFALPSRAVSTLLGCSREGALALLIGCFCGFPVGGRLLSDLCAEQRISPSERNRLLPLANHPSFVFFCSTFGNGMLHSRKNGLLLYLSVLIATLTLGIATRHTESPLPKAPAKTAKKSISPSALLTESVRSSTFTALIASGFIIFFAVCSASAEGLLIALGLPKWFSLLLSGTFELSRGIQKAAEMMEYPASRLCGTILCGFFAGFGGLSAHLQVIATVEDRLPGGAEEHTCTLRSFVMWKFAEGGLSALIYFLLFRVGNPL